MPYSYNFIPKYTCWHKSQLNKRNNSYSITLLNYMKYKISFKIVFYWGALKGWKIKKALLIVNGDQDHSYREHLELQVGSMRVSSILTAGSLTSRPQSRSDCSFIIGAKREDSVSSCLHDTLWTLEHCWLICKQHSLQGSISVISFRS